MPAGTDPPAEGVAPAAPARTLDQPQPQPQSQPQARRPLSLRRYLLLGILPPVLVLIAINSAVLYRNTLQALNTAYDRTLLASAKSIGEQLDVVGYDGLATVQATVPFSALEAFEADNQSRMYYRVSSLSGELVSGFAELPMWRGRIPDRPPYAALVDFYDAQFRGVPVRVAVLLQPVASERGRGMAVVQVAETLELRRTLARRVLWDTWLGQALLLGVVALLVVLVVQRATRPVRRLSAELRARPDGRLTPLQASDAPRELLPLVDATNQVMQRLQHLLDHQQRFVRDTAHQLRTPLAVLKTQVQSALRGDAPPTQALREIEGTVDRATALANQMLTLAKVEQLRQQAAHGRHDLADAVREVALDLAPLVADKGLDFDLAAEPAEVQAHEWMLRELTRNLLHNAIRHTPPGGALSVRVGAENGWAVLHIADSGPGIADELRNRLFQPFSAGGPGGSGSGLGLAICHEIVRVLGGSIGLDNRVDEGRIAGLDTTVRLPAPGHEGARPMGYRPGGARPQPRTCCAGPLRRGAAWQGTPPLPAYGPNQPRRGFGLRPPTGTAGAVRVGTGAPRGTMAGMKTVDSLRLDKWLWSARFFKTRSLAAEEIGRGRVQVNGITAKASRDLKPGDRVALRHDFGIRTVQVLLLSAQRGPATVAQTLYAETPESVAARETRAEFRRLAPEPALGQTAGRPTKRDRRELQNTTHGWNDRWSASMDE